ncbi:MAG: hypothetical protein ACRDKW_11120, partial [Actinomycetota bacterium]
AALGANPQAVARFLHGEVLSNAWGQVSDTSAFTNAQGSADVDGDKDLHWGAVKIGVLKPLVSFQGNGRRDSHVKMHLVNSYLHPQANAWVDNWVFGPHDLNAKHTQLETAATLGHPHLDPTKAALSYRTEVTGADAQALTEDQLAHEIHGKIDAIAQGVPGFQTRPLATVKARAKVNGQTLAAYAGNWTAALANNIVANKVKVESRTYTLDGAANVVQGALTTKQAQTAEVSRVQAVLNFKYMDPVNLAGKGIIFEPPAGSKHGGGPSGGSPPTKKSKVSA